MSVVWNEYKSQTTQVVANYLDGFKTDCEYLERKRGKESFTDEEKLYLDQWAPERRRVSKEVLDVEGDYTSDLLFSAQIGRIHALCPYSHFSVGAAILVKGGRVFTGCNVENAAFSPTICAERTAFTKAVSTINEGRSCLDSKTGSQFIACAIVLQGGGSPCGVCRQVLHEGNSEMRIIMGDIDGTYKESILSQLLPDAFGPKDLGL